MNQYLPVLRRVLFCTIILGVAENARYDPFPFAMIEDAAAIFLFAWMLGER